LRKPERLKLKMKNEAAIINPGFDDDQKMGRKSLQPSQFRRSLQVRRIAAKI